MKPFKNLLLLALVLFWSFYSQGQGLPMSDSKPEMTLKLEETELEVRFIAKDLVVPWEILWGYDNWIWFTEREGNIKKVHPETGEIKLIHKIDSVYQSWDNTGLEAMVFHPDFPETPYLYVHYAISFTETLMVRLTYDVDTESIVGHKVLLDDIYTKQTHMGSRLKFGPDGKLYFSTGDALKKKLAQKMDSHNGKVLRMNADGSIPDDNPFPGSYIYTLGHRDPQGLVFAPDGTLYSSEHGDDNDDELNIIVKGRNYGYPNVKGKCDRGGEKGFCEKNNIVEPIYSWSPTIAVCGIDFYDHPAIPEWQNSILLVAMKGKELHKIGQRMLAIQLTDDGKAVNSVTSHLHETFGRLRTVMISPDGRVYVTTTNQEKKTGYAFVREGDDKIIELRPKSLNKSSSSSQK